MDYNRCMYKIGAKAALLRHGLLDQTNKTAMSIPSELTGAVGHSLGGAALGAGGGAAFGGLMGGHGVQPFDTDHAITGGLLGGVVGAGAGAGVHARKLQLAKLQAVISKLQQSKQVSGAASAASAAEGAVAAPASAPLQGSLKARPAPNNDAGDLLVNSVLANGGML